jgi:hypothetical protein
VRRHRFVVLLCALILLLALSPVARALGPRSQSDSGIGFTVLFAAMLLAAVFAVSRSRATQTIAIALAVPVVVLRGLNTWLQHDGIAIVHHVLSILFLGYVVALLLRVLFVRRSVTADTICASLCVYLVLGVLWAVVFSLVHMLDPAAFAFGFADDGGAESMRFGAERFAFAIYYSFVTMSTLGYGDIVPASEPARMLAVVEAVMGQLYLAVLVARLVGLHISQSSAGDKRVANQN